MKKLPLALLFTAISMMAYAQAEVVIHDTRDANDLPSLTKHRLRLDFKRKNVIGLPGDNGYSTSMTISPWLDNSGGFVHQLNFNDEGIFHRTGAFNASSWNTWREIVVKNEKGSILTAPNIPGIIYNQNDVFTYDQKVMGHYSLGWFRDSWINEGPTFWLSSWGGIKVFTRGQPRLSIRIDGRVGIGTTDPEHKLDVVGTIRAHQVLVNTQKGADFVFEDGYALRPLEEVEQFISENKHLPDIPSAEAMVQQGVDMGELQVQLLQKIEELTLYIIELKKENSILKQEMEAMKKRQGNQYNPTKASDI